MRGDAAATVTVLARQVIAAKFVRQILLDKELDQRKLAEISGVSEPTITRLMQGRPFTSETLGKLAEA